MSTGVPDAETTIVTTIRSLLERREAFDVEITRDARIQEDLDLDSLEVAELSATLEDDLGRDPYTEGLIPSTVGEILAFYAA